MGQQMGCRETALFFTWTCLPPAEQILMLIQDALHQEYFNACVWALCPWESQHWVNTCEWMKGMDIYKLVFFIFIFFFYSKWSNTLVTSYTLIPRSKTKARDDNIMLLIVPPKSASCEMLPADFIFVIINDIWRLQQQWWEACVCWWFLGTWGTWSTWWTYSESTVPPKMPSCTQLSFRIAPCYNCFFPQKFTALTPPLVFLHRWQGSREWVSCGTLWPDVTQRTGSRGWGPDIWGGWDTNGDSRNLTFNHSWTGRFGPRVCGGVFRAHIHVGEFIFILINKTALASP